jgi:hypothetical protein
MCVCATFVILAFDWWATDREAAVTVAGAAIATTNMDAAKTVATRRSVGVVVGGAADWKWPGMGRSPLPCPGRTDHFSGAASPRCWRSSNRTNGGIAQVFGGRCPRPAVRCARAPFLHADRNLEEATR